MKPELHRDTHEAIEALLRKPQGSWIFAGDSSAEQIETAKWAACALHGHAQPASECIRCKQIMSGTHPDIHILEPADSGSIGIADVHMLTHEFSVTRHDHEMPFRLGLIKAAETLTSEAQNALLKLLEEPPADTILILAVKDSSKLLETVKSRCRVILFRSNGVDTITEADSKASQLWVSSSFDNLVAAQAITTENISDFIGRAAKELAHSQRGATPEQMRKLAASQTALVKLQRNINQNVSPKAALGAFFLELP